MALPISIPGWGDLQIAHVLFDLNGTLACDGLIAPSTRDRLMALGERLTLYVMTADTHGTLEQAIEGLPLHPQRVQRSSGRTEKRDFLHTLEPDRTIAIGNGRNDVAMLEDAALGIVVLGPEGAAKEALLAADIVFTHIDEVLDSLLNPVRLVATLRG